MCIFEYQIHVLIKIIFQDIQLGPAINTYVHINTYKYMNIYKPIVVNQASFISIRTSSIIPRVALQPQNWFIFQMIN